jgi:tRNA threonylcarbamoyladenosine biosynthesis protein TsaB
MAKWFRRSSPRRHGSDPYVVNAGREMNFLSLDTSTARGAIGLSVRSGEVFVASTEGGRRHGRDLIPGVAAILRAAGVGLRDIEVLAVGLGPGSYTGLRVGLTAAKTLAYATGAALIGLDSLHAIACNAPEGAPRVSVIADAQRGQLYVAEFVRPEGGRLVPARAIQIEPLTAWLARLEPGTVVLGPALDSPRIRSALPPGLEIPDSTLNCPVGHHLIELARETWSGGRRDDPWLLEPCYLRQSSAEEQWNARTAPAPAETTPSSS